MNRINLVNLQNKGLCLNAYKTYNIILNTNLNTVSGIYENVNEFQETISLHDKNGYEFLYDVSTWEILSKNINLE
jgi:hypothetical protein